MGALSATWKKEFREGFEPLVPGFEHVPFNDADALTAAVDRETAAVLLEAVQGEGGVHVASPEYLPVAREVCDREGALLLLDVQPEGGRRMTADEYVRGTRVEPGERLGNAAKPV